MTAVAADTQSIIWYLTNSPKLSAVALAALDDAIQNGDLIYVSSITIVEATYLVEKNRIAETTMAQLTAILKDSANGYKLAPLSLEIAQAVRQVPREIVPEMPDRIIAATALQMGVPLVTSDLQIRASNVTTIW